MDRRSKRLMLVVVMSVYVQSSHQHGRVIDPPARSTAWRYGYDTPVDYDDNQLYCGGLQVQWGQNGGRCGICGDAYNGTRDHEYPGGKFTNPLRITGSYASGGIIFATIELTTVHMGYFMFRLCPETSEEREVSQNCLDKHVLPILSSNSESDRFYIHNEKPASNYTLPLRLPSDLTCSRCVLQWTYTTGNTWGSCSNGVSETGCGPQETFRGCSDILIYSRSSVSPAIQRDRRTFHPFVR